MSKIVERSFTNNSHSSIIVSLKRKAKNTKWFQFWTIPIIDSENHASIRNIDIKLKNLGLITEPITFDSGELEVDTNKNNILINLYC